MHSSSRCTAWRLPAGLDETDLVRMVFPDAEILSVGFHTLEEARAKVKPLLADRLTAARRPRSKV